MARRSFTPEQIIAKLRQIEVLIGQGIRWREVAGRLGSRNRAITAGVRSIEVSEAKRLRELEEVSRRNF